MSDLKETLLIFIKDLEERRFYDAHEHMEAYWHTIRKTDHPLRNLCKGFINGATAFELIRLKRYDAARRVWKTHEKYLGLMQDGIEEYLLFQKANDILFSLKKEHRCVI